MHMKQCNFGELLQCDICQKNFANKRNLRDHVRVFHEKENLKEDSKYHFPCPECDKVFYKKSNLKSHLIRHSDLLPFICDAPGCGKGFKREKTLLKHYQVMFYQDPLIYNYSAEKILYRTTTRYYLVSFGRQTNKI